MRLSWLLRIPMATVLVLLPMGLRADSLDDYVKGAFAAEERQTHSRTEFRVRRRDKSTDYLIERVLPDRIHMRIRGGPADQEVYVIGPRMFVLVDGTWREGPTPTGGRLPVSMTAFVGDRLAGAREETTDDQRGTTRVFVVDGFDWQAGTGKNVGSLVIEIDVARQLPSRMRFDGRCQKVPCGFEQVVTFDPAMVIDSPVP